MKTRIALSITLLAVAVLASGCGLFRSAPPWPDRALNMARRIELAVHGTGVAEADASTTGTVNNATRIMRELAFDSPRVYDALISRRARLQTVLEMKSAALVGENNRGMLASPEERPLTSKADLDKAAGIIAAENADRLIVYKAAARRLKRGGINDLTRIRDIWAAVLRDHARAGDWFQAPRAREPYEAFLRSDLGKALLNPPLPGQWAIIHVGDRVAMENAK